MKYDGSKIYRMIAMPVFIPFIIISFSLIALGLYTIGIVAALVIIAVAYKIKSIKERYLFIKCDNRDLEFRFADDLGGAAYLFKWSVIEGVEIRGTDAVISLIDSQVNRIVKIANIKASSKGINSIYTYANMNNIDFKLVK